VQWCDAANVPGCSPYIHRDENAAMNFRWCLMNGRERPLHLRYSSCPARGPPADAVGAVGEVEVSAEFVFPTKTISMAAKVAMISFLG
jgi:hypothetical protein